MTAAHLTLAIWVVVLARSAVVWWFAPDPDGLALGLGLLVWHGAGEWSRRAGGVAALKPSTAIEMAKRIEENVTRHGDAISSAKRRDFEAVARWLRQCAAPGAERRP